MTVDMLVLRDLAVNKLREALSMGRGGQELVPRLVRQTLELHAWECRRVGRQQVGFTGFAELITTRAPEGLETDLKTIRQWCAHDPIVLDAIDQATQKPSSLHAVNNVHSIDRPSGNTPLAAIRRLRKDRPDLHALVLAGELSPHGAMVEAGFRPRTISVPLTVDGVFRAAFKLSPAERAELKTLLAGSD